MIARAGFAAPCVGITDPSTTKRLSIPHTRWLASTTEASGAKPTPEPARLVRLVELFGRDLGRRRLVHPQQLGKPRRCLRRPLHHHVPADDVVVVAEPVWMCRTRRVEQKPRCLDRVAADGDGSR